MRDFLLDLRFGARIFRRKAGLTALAILALSLGIGANAAIFAVLQAAWLRPLPFPESARLLLLLDGRRSDRTVSSPTIPEILELRTASRTLDAVGFFDTRDFQVTGGEEPERVIGARVDPSLFPLLGGHPAVGHIFNAEEARAAGDAVVLLSDGLWRRNFAGNPAIIGGSLALNGVPHRIAGVLPADFSLNFLSGAPVDIYVPYPSDPGYWSRQGEFANVRRVIALARLAPGVSLEAAESELASAAGAMAERFPGIYRPLPGVSGPPFTMSAEPLRESLTRGSRPILLLLLGTVLLLLLTACVNTAQFLLVQTTEREGEVALRAALGAGRWRLIRQFGSETLLVTGIGGALGVLQAVWLTRILQTLVPAGTPLVGRVGVDRTVLLAMLALTAITAIVCTLVPTLRLSRFDLARSMETRGGARRVRSRQWFIAAEVAMSVILLVGAGLLIRSLRELQRSQGGFSPARISVMRVRGIGNNLGDSYPRYLERILAVPGVEIAAATSSVLPGRPGNRFTIPGDSSSNANRRLTSYQMVSGDYFTALGIPLYAGRFFTDADAHGHPAVAIVNREMAERFWPGSSPLGRQIRAGDGPRDATMTIVGVVGNIRPPFQSGDSPQLYVPYRQQPEPNMMLMVRARPGVAPPFAAIKDAIRSVEPRQAVFAFTSMDDLLAQSTANQRSIATLIGGFALLALAMSISGIYTVVTYIASRRVKEIAVRRAIGATGRDVVWSLAAPAFRWTVAGLILGIAGAFTGSRMLRAAISGILPLDTGLTALIAGLYLLVVSLAIAGAARGALRIEPSAALRAE